MAERTVDPLRLIAKHVQRRHRLGVCQWCDCRPLWSLIRSAPLETCQHLLIIFLFNLGEAKGLLLWLHEICWHLLDGCWARPLCGRGHRRLIIARRWRLGDLWRGDRPCRLSLLSLLSLRHVWREWWQGLVLIEVERSLEAGVVRLEYEIKKKQSPKKGRSLYLVPRWAAGT